MNISLRKNINNCTSFFMKQWRTIKPFFFDVLGIIAVIVVILFINLCCLAIAEYHVIDKMISVIESNGLSIIILSLAVIICLITAVVKWNKIRSFVKNNIWVFSLVLLYILFYPLWESLIEKHIISKFLCNFQRNDLNDTIFGIAVIGCCVLCYFNRNKHIKQSTVVQCVILLAFWFYYRFNHSPLGLEKDTYYLGFKELNYDTRIKYVDIIPIYAICTIISPYFGKLGKYIISKLSKKNANHNEIKGFIRDYPFDCSKDIDILGRKDLARIQMARLLATDTANGSFTFGIDAPWGAGKTSFMIMMKELVHPSEKKKQKNSDKAIEKDKNNKDKHKYDDVILLDFNPWLYSEEKDLVTVFMDELSKNLKQYDLSLAKNILDYSRLLSAFDTKETKIIASLIDLVHHNCTLKEKKQQIRDAILRINRRIVVFVDDIDRLDANEIMEMMKLIRNISDFPKMYFVAAYDKEYLIKCLNTIMPTKGADFIGKIFQHEYRLPLSSNIINSIALPNYLESLLSTEDQANLFPEDGDKNQLPKISNLREAKRFANSFSSHYAIDMAGNKIKSFYLLELFKIRYPLAFAFFESNWEMVITEEESLSDSEKSFCKLNDGTSNHSSINYKNHIDKNYKKLGMNDEDKLIVENILSLLFGEKGFINSIDILRDYFNPTV